MPTTITRQRRTTATTATTRTDNDLAHTGRHVLESRQDVLGVSSDVLSLAVDTRSQYVAAGD
ncbi:MAG: hypothetical protein J07HB67_00077 [halophilic archaeon J07HB67]|nr:MAG: hypothetical protein J07HB67_00077 [halophilic archaeon J07HB67]